MKPHWANLDSDTIQFACSHGDLSVLPLFFVASTELPPQCSLSSAEAGARLGNPVLHSAGIWQVTLTVDAAPPNAPDDELRFTIIAQIGDEEIACDIVLRRTSCRLNLHAIESTSAPISEQTRAALLWHGWNQYEAIVGVKRFTSGLSGSDVLVCSPRLRDPATLPAGQISDKLRGRIPGGILNGSCGASLLVKTGPAKALSEEWERCQVLLRDRMTPFIARNDAHVTAQLASETAVLQPDDKSTIVWQSTLIGNFLGGEILPTESLESLVQGADDANVCTAAIDSLFNVLKVWHRNGAVKTLGDWSFMVGRPVPAAPRRLFARFDLGSDEDHVFDGVHRYQGRNRYAQSLEWENDFKSSAHLAKFLLGTARQPGLLDHLESIPLHFSLTHGDMNPRNALMERDHAWVIDFGHLGVGPTLFDFAHLEVCLRLWCLRLDCNGGEFMEGAQEFEQHLLNHLLGHESSWQEVRDIAPLVGAPAAHLLKIAHTIDAIRHNARPYFCDQTEGRDYLAVLYLAVLRILGISKDAATLLQRRWLVALAWTLEEQLCRSFGLTPYAREQSKYLPRTFVSVGWLEAPRAPERVVYLLNRQDGAAALPEVAALRGVVQGGSHHLDVFDHTLLVLAYLEELLDDPMRGLLEPESLDERVAKALSSQGIVFPRPNDVNSTVAGNYEIDSSLNDEIHAVLQETLSPDNRCLLKWVALLHDCGKPMSRTISPNRRGPRVRFIGHPIFGVQLVRPLLEYLFADSAASTCSVDRACHLIERHHLHHEILDNCPGEQGLTQIATIFADNNLGKLKQLKRALDTEQQTFPEHFPLLLLHGFADCLACRGFGSPASPSHLAAFNRLLLGIYARRDRFDSTQTQLRQSRAAVATIFEDWRLRAENELGQQLESRVVGRLRRWMQNAWETENRPTYEDFLEQARQQNSE